MDTGTVLGVTKPISRLALGTMIVNTKELERSYRLLDDALECGITTLDTANVYAGGDSERAIGRWMEERGNRDRVVILTKGCHHNQDRKRVTPWDISADIHDSLARLRTSYLDIWLLHRDDLDVPVGPIVEALNEHHAAGRIRAFGGSNWTHGRIAEANEYAEKHGLVPFTASSPNYSLAAQVADPWGGGSVTLSGPESADARKWYAETGMPIFAWSSMARGFFSGRVTRDALAADPSLLDGAATRAYAHETNFRRLDRVSTLAKEKGLTVPQIALAYVVSSPLPVHPIVGAANREEIEANVAAAEVKLTEREREWLDLEREDR